MTVNSMMSRVVHAGDGTTVSFSIPISFQSEWDLIVTQTESGVNDGKGTLLLKTAPKPTQRITVFRDPSLLRTISYPVPDPVPAASLELELDRLSMVDQAQDTQLARSLRFPITDGAANPLPAASGRANGCLAFDGAGKTQPLVKLVGAVDAVADRALQVPGTPNTWATHVSIKILPGGAAANDMGWYHKQADSVGTTGNVYPASGHGGTIAWSDPPGGPVRDCLFERQVVDQKRHQTAAIPLPICTGYDPVRCPAPERVVTGRHAA